VGAKTSRTAICGITACVLAGLAFALLWFQVSCEQRYKEGVLELVRYHADMLISGDFRTAPLSAHGAAVPYHLERLLEFGDESGPILLEMLDNTSGTPIECVGEAMFFRTHMQVLKEGDKREVRRKATIADIANWALKEVYHVPRGVGFRGDLPPAQKQEAIARWRKVIEDYESAEAEKRAKEARRQDPPGELFPKVPAAH